MNYKLLCPADGFTKTVAAASKEEAVQLLLADADVQTHVATAHPELAGKTPEETTQMLLSMVTEEVPAVGEAPTGGDATGGAPTGGTV